MTEKFRVSCAVLKQMAKINPASKRPIFSSQWKWNSLRCVVSANVICEGSLKRCPSPDVKAGSMVVGEQRLLMGCGFESHQLQNSQLYLIF